MSETRMVAVRSSDGSLLQGILTLWEESPNDSDAVRLELAFSGLSFGADSEVGYFDALSEIRQAVEPSCHRLVCFGSSLGVFPSGMSRSMGTGEQAYKLEIGRPASTKDLVSIFDVDESVVPVTLDEQLAHYNLWLASLPRRT